MSPNIQVVNMKSHIKNAIDMSADRWRYVHKGRGIFKGRPQCPRCKNNASASLDSPVGKYSIWSCPKCNLLFALFPESHFRKCPFCFRIKKHKKLSPCSVCKDRRWIRI